MQNWFKDSKPNLVQDGPPALQRLGLDFFFFKIIIIIIIIIIYIYT